MKDNASISTLSVEGNTDNAGEPKFDNTALSQSRAQAVVDFLASKGIDKGRLQAKGYGSSNPLAPNDTPAHMALNRRVEFHVLSFNGQPVPKDSSGGAGGAGGAGAGASGGTGGAAPAASASSGH
jgi:OOP family OmpA-OmpF porin